MRESILLASLAVMTASVFGMNNSLPVVSGLFSACKSGNADLVKYLVEHGANVNNENGKTPLVIACEKGRKSIVKYLVEHGETPSVEAD